MPSIAETQARIVAELNPPGQPFRYTAQGNQIIGAWDIADVTYQAIAESGSIDKDYSLTVTLDEASGTYDFSERKTSVLSNWTFQDGKLQFTKTGSFFKGKSVGRERGVGAAPHVTSHGQEGQTWSYDFSTARIKEPLFALLQDAGWQPAKKGFIGRLFSH